MKINIAICLLWIASLAAAATYQEPLPKLTLAQAIQVREAK